MLKLFYILFFMCFNLTINAQHSVIYTNVVDIEFTDSIFIELKVFKQISDSTFIFKTKTFNKQTLVSLDKGYYIFGYYINNNLFYCTDLRIENYPMVSVFNILMKQQSLNDFDFSKTIAVSEGMFELTLRKDIYMEF